MKHKVPDWIIWWFAVGLALLCLSLPVFIAGLVIPSDTVSLVASLMATLGSTSAALSLLKGQDLQKTRDRVSDNG